MTDAPGWDGYSDSEAIDELERDARAQFQSRPESDLCTALGVEPHFSVYRWGYPVCIWDDSGLIIGETDEGAVYLAVDIERTTWTLTTSIQSREKALYEAGSKFWEGTRTVYNNWDVAAYGSTLRDVAARTSAALRGLAVSTLGFEQTVILAGLLSWGAMTDHPEQSVWALTMLKAKEDEEGFHWPHNTSVIAAQLEESFFALPEHVAQLRRWS